MSWLGEAITNKTLVTYFLKGEAPEEYAKKIAETLTENELVVEIGNSAHDITEVIDFKTSKKEEIADEAKKINK